MVRKNFYLTEMQEATLCDWDELTVSEHIRRALDEYIERERRKKMSVSLSPSIVIHTVKGGKDGRFSNK